MADGLVATGVVEACDVVMMDHAGPSVCTRVATKS